MRLRSFLRIAFIVGFSILALVPNASYGQTQTLASRFPFLESTAEYLGPLNLTGRSDGLYDFQPSIMYDADDAVSPFRMWWHGQNPGADPGDAIYYADSVDGQSWSDPQLVLTPQLGTGGDEWADDHLLGAMSVIRVDGTYYMFYEAYTSWVTPINRFFNFTAGDTWTTHGTPQNDQVIDVAKDAWEKALGVAWRYPKSYSATDVSHPVYAGEVVHADDKRDRFLARTAVVARTDAFGSEFSPMYDGRPVFHLFSTDGGDRGRKPIYEFFDPANRNTYVTDDNSGEGIPGTIFNELLGYAASDLDTIDMRHALQNQVMMATSPDGINWTRFRGAGPGGAVASPIEPYTNLFNFDASSANGLPRHAFQGEVGSQLYWDIHRAYGSGFPSVLVRDGNIELFFTDDSQEIPPIVFPSQHRFRVPVDQIENPQAYLDAVPTRRVTYYGNDVKWSPVFQRYFYTNLRIDPANPNKWSPEVQWSDGSSSVLTFESVSTFAEILPTSDVEPRGGGQGGLAGTPLGHTLDFPDAPNPHSVFHLYYSASDPEFIEDFFNKDLDHVVVFGFHGNFRYSDGVVFVNGVEVADGDTIDFGNSVLGQPKTLTIHYDSRSSPRPFLLRARSSTTGDFSNDMPAVPVPGRFYDLTFEAAQLGHATGTTTVSVNAYFDLLPHEITLNLVGFTESPPVGDFNEDGLVNCDDLNFFVGNMDVSAVGEVAQLDLTSDGLVTIDDVHEVLDHVATSSGATGAFLGDFNCDGAVDVLGDAFILIASLGAVDVLYTDGDATFDGACDVLGDAFVLIGNLGVSNQ